MERQDYTFLLAEYRQIWNNRLLQEAGGNSEYTLKEAIKRELLDENSHPRARKSKHVKFYLAVERIISSGLEDKTKVKLIDLHIGLMDEMEKE